MTILTMSRTKYSWLGDSGLSGEAIQQTHLITRRFPESLLAGVAGGLLHDRQTSLLLGQQRFWSSSATTVPLSNIADLWVAPRTCASCPDLPLEKTALHVLITSRVRVGGPPEAESTSMPSGGNDQHEALVVHQLQPVAALHSADDRAWQGFEFSSSYRVFVAFCSGIPRVRTQVRKGFFPKSEFATTGT